MALIVLLLINLSIIHINYIEAARNTDTNVDNTPIAWIRKWCAICETIIIRLKEAVDAFSKTIINRDMEKSTTPRRNQASVPIGKPQLTAENIPSRTTRRDQASAPIDKRQLTAENKASQTNNRQISDPNDGVFMKVGDETFIINEKVPNPPNLAKVFMADLESVVFHIISNDFARYNPLPWQGSGFLFFLARYFPQKNERVSSLLSELDDFVSGIINNNGTVDRIQLRRKVLELLKTYPMKANKWISCRGSENRLNCGLWLLFHTMSMAWTIKYNPGSTVPANRCIQFIQRFVEWYHPDMVGNEADTFLNLVQEDLSYLNSTMVLWDFHNTGPHPIHEMIPQQLVPHEDIAIKLWKKTTTHYVNTAPLWKALVPIMKAINYGIRQAAIKVNLETYDENTNSGDDLDIYTTTYSYESFWKRMMHSIANALHFRQEPFGWNVWCKFVYYRSKNQGIMIFLHNLPGNPPVKVDSTTNHSQEDPSMKQTETNDKDNSNKQTASSPKGNKETENSKSDELLKEKECETPVLCDFKKWSSSNQPEQGLSNDLLEYAYCCEVNKKKVEQLFGIKVENEITLLDIEGMITKKSEG